MHIVALSSDYGITASIRASWRSMSAYFVIGRTRWWAAARPASSRSSKCPVDWMKSACFGSWRLVAGCLIGSWCLSIQFHFWAEKTWNAWSSRVRLWRPDSRCKCCSCSYSKPHTSFTPSFRSFAPKTIKFDSTNLSSRPWMQQPVISSYDLSSSY